MHSVFPTSVVNIKDLISRKKMIEKDGQWRVERGVLVWKFEGVETTMVLEDKRIEAILVTLNKWS